MPKNEPGGPEINEYLLSQKSAMDVLTCLGYEQLPPERAEQMRSSMDACLLKPILKRKLTELNRYEYKGREHPFSEKNIEQAMKDIDATMEDGLMKTNEKIYDMLMLGKSYPETVGGGVDQKSQSFTLQYIDWEHPENNALHFVPEFSVERFRKRLNQILEAYKTKRLTETEYLNDMQKALEDYQSGKPLTTYPQKIQNKPRAQVVYDLLQKHLSGKDESGETQAFAELAEKVIEGAGKHIKVGFQDNPDVKNSIEQEIYTTWFEYCNRHGIDADLEKLDELMPILFKTIKSQDWGL